MTLSDRLEACISYVNQNDRVADIGCDHGLLGIALLERGIARSVIAADVGEGPLSAAKLNAQRHGLDGKMTFFLSDGVEKIPRDFDTLVCAGMGGDTMIHILSAAPWLNDDRYRLILQCQSKRPELRRWLYEHDYAISRETLAQDGKFLYTVMEVRPGTVNFTPLDTYLSPALRECGSPLLRPFCTRLLDGLSMSAAGLAHRGERDAELEAVIAELSEFKEALQ